MFFFKPIDHRIISLALFFCLFLIPWKQELRSQNYPVIHDSRPRIWTSQSRFDYISQHLSQGECGATYTSFLNAYNASWITDPELYMVGSDTTLWTWNWSSQWAQYQSIFTVFLWKVNHQPLQLQRCRFLVRQCYDYLDTVNLTGMEWYAKETFIRTYSDAAGLLLDWCHDSLPASDRQLLTLSLYKLQKHFMEVYILSSSGNSYVSSHNALNCVQAMQNCLVLHNADGLTPVKNDSVTYWYQILNDKWNTGFLPCYTYYRDDDGGWNWGAAYAMWSLTDQFKFFDNMLFGTDKNYYTDLPWIEESINQYWYFIQPNDFSIHLGDGVARLYADNVVYRHAAVFQDPRSQWMAQYYSQNQFITWTAPRFWKLFYKDFEAPIVSKPSPPLNWWSDKVGLSVSRSSWDSDATMVWFFNSPSKRASHEHRDNNSFGVFHHKPLLIDAGYYDSYGSTHFKNYYTRTIAHNSICVFDPYESYFYGNEVVANDGGQLYSPALINYNSIFEPGYQRGKWLQFVSDASYCYNHADASLSYDTSKVKKSERRLLFWKPGKILVVDHLVLNQVNEEPRDVSWVVHTVNQPSVNGLLTGQEVPGHIMTYNGHDYLAANGPANVAVRTLLPSQTSATVIGGEGYQYWVNGTNYPPATSPDTILGTPGNWRLEVRPSVIEDSLVLIHTIQTGDLLQPAQAGGVAISNKYSVGADWGDVVFLFNSTGDTASEIHVADSLAGNRQIELFAADLPRQDSFSLFIDNQYFGKFMSEEEGIIRTTVVLGEGYHTLTLSKYCVSGNLVYNNADQAPVPYATISIMQNQQLLYQVVSDSMGHFRLPILTAGTVQMQVSCSLSWGGVNTTDALLTLKHFVQISILPGLRALAADVDGSGMVNTLDALYVAKRFIQSITYFPVGDWIFESPLVNLIPGQNATISIQGLCYGDVNGSYTP